MNFLELYEELIEVLSENSAAAPEYWSMAELKRYLNRGNNEVTRKGKFNKFLLPLQPAELGAFYPPSDILALEQVYYNGKALDHKAVEFLDVHYGGTSHQELKSGDGKSYCCSWRDEVGEPIHWYFENNKIKLFPVPTSAPVTLSVVRGKLTGTIADGDTGITLAGSIPLDQNRVDFYYGGIYQNKDQWSITNASTITFTGWSAVVDNDYEIVYIPDTVSSTTIQRSEKYIRYVSAGQTTVIVPGGYVQGVGALAVKKNGISQAPSAFTETAPGFITIPAPADDCTYEITVTRPDPILTVSILYCQTPTKMVNDSDTPQIDNEDWQRGIVHYAAHLALSKEGKMTQDLQKAQIHFARFSEVIEMISTLTSPQIDVSPYVSMPFKV